MRYAPYLFLLLLCFCAGLNAQVDPNVVKDPTKWTVTLDKPAQPKIGDVVTVHFATAIGAGYHLYSVKPYTKVGPTPTTLELDPETKGVAKAGALQEQGHLKSEFDDVFELEVHYFKEKVAFSQAFKITADNPRLTGVLRFQYCNDYGCKYGTQEFDYTIQTTASTAVKKAEGDSTIIPKDTTQETAAQITSQTPAETQPMQAEAAPAENTTDESDLWTRVSIAFFAGLASLLTPCVFPLIPMTVSFFTKRSKNRKQGIRNAFIYSASIIFIFVVLSLFLSIAFGEETVYHISTNPWVNLSLFAVILLFALSFLGMFELSLPSSWVTKIDAQSDRGGISGIFFMALTLVIASFSCIGPIAGNIFIVAAGGGFWEPVVIMLGYSVGIALPFALFAVFPGWMQSLPKSGGWMNAVKVTLGFVELALCLKFLSNADLYMHWGLLNRDLFLAIWIICFALLGIYLLGKIRLPHDHGKMENLPVPRLILAMSSLAFALYLVPGMFGAQLSWLSGLLPPPSEADFSHFVQQQGAHGNAVQTANASSEVCSLPRKYADILGHKTPHGFCTFFDIEEAQAYAKKVNKPVFIDFTGHTCANCRQMEHKVWPDKRVSDLLQKEYVMVSLYVDEKEPLPQSIKLPDGKKLRTVGDKFLQLQIDKYGALAQPFYVLVDGEDNMLTTKGVGYTPDVDEYVAFLESGLKKFKERNGGTISQH